MQFYPYVFSERKKEMISAEQGQKERICSYWNKRSKSFAQLRAEELQGSISNRWLDEITKYLPSGKKLNILDVGTGTGFFAFLLSELGHRVVGIDLCCEMIEEAKRLSEENGLNVDFRTMDAENPSFADETFDVVISRNLTWTLIRPGEAYGQWIRVLKKGGLLLNFDADYSKESFSEKDETLPKEHAHNHIDKELLQEWDSINKALPLNEKKRPDWDKAFLEETGCSEVCVDDSISNRVYIEIDKFYNPVPMFLIKAVK